MKYLETYSILNNDILFRGFHGKILCSVIVPMYNEEEVITETYTRLTKVMDGIGENYEIIFINDGSRDNTGAIIREFCKNNKRIK